RAAPTGCAVIAMSVVAHGLPKIDVAIAEGEIGWEHADNLARLRADSHLAADDRFLAAEPALPETITDHHDVGDDRYIFLSRKEAAAEGTWGEQGEEVGGGEAILDLFEVIARAQDGASVAE